MTRADHLVALGGGVVGDLAGFCAATYQRGVAVVQVPTTLVAQVDSAYGGKTGVDLPEAKNYVGAYHLPAAVLADPAPLATLPASRAGGRVRRGDQDGADRRRARCGSACGRSSARPGGARRRDLRLRADQARGRRRRRARQRAARGAQPRPHGRPRDRGRDRLRALPPRRGGRPRPAGDASALRRRASCASEVAASARAHGPADQARLPRSRSRRCWRRSSATRSAPSSGLGFVLLERPGEPRPGERDRSG